MHQERMHFIDSVIDLRDDTIELAAAGGLSAEVLGQATLLVNHAIEGVLSIIDGNPRQGTGYLMVPNHMIEEGQTFHNMAGDLAPCFNSLFDVINLR
jgi:hypothetical protein